MVKFPKWNSETGFLPKNQASTAISNAGKGMKQFTDARVSEVKKASGPGWILYVILIAAALFLWSRFTS